MYTKRSVLPLNLREPFLEYTEWILINKIQCYYNDYYYNYYFLISLYK